jgi:hypothetical protein
MFLTLQLNNVRLTLAHLVNEELFHFILQFSYLIQHIFKTELYIRQHAQLVQHSAQFVKQTTLEMNNASNAFLHL